MCVAVYEAELIRNYRTTVLHARLKISDVALSYTNQMPSVAGQLQLCPYRSLFTKFLTFHIF